MKRDFSGMIMNMDGRPYIKPVVKYDEHGIPVHKDGQPEFSHFEKMTYRSFALEALAGRWKGEENMAIDDISKRMRVYDKLCFAENGLVELETADGQLILDCLNKQGRDPLVIARMKALLEKDPS